MAKTAQVQTVSLLPDNANAAEVDKWALAQDNADYECFQKLRELLEALRFVQFRGTSEEHVEIREIIVESELLIRQRETICNNMLRALNNLPPDEVPEV